MSFWLFTVSRLNCATPIVPKRSATAVAAVSFAITSALPLVIHPATLKPIYMVTSEPMTAPHEPCLIFSQSIRHLPLNASLDHVGLIHRNSDKSTSPSIGSCRDALHQCYHEH